MIKKILVVSFLIGAIALVCLRAVNNRNDEQNSQAQPLAASTAVVPVAPVENVEQGKIFHGTSNSGSRLYRIDVNVRSGLSDQKQNFKRPVVTDGTNMFPSAFAMQANAGKRKMTTNDWARIQGIRATYTNLPPLQVAPILGE